MKLGSWCGLVVDAGLCRGCVRSRPLGQPEGAGNARRALSVLVKASAKGQRAGSRSSIWRERLTMTAGTEMRRVRLVRFVTGGWLASRVVQCPRLWARTAQASQAALAW